MQAKVLEVSYHRTVNLGKYNSVMLGGKLIADVDPSDDKMACYQFLQAKLQTEVDAIADRIGATATT